VIPPLHLVTDDAILSGEGFLSRAREVLRAGGGEVALHVRGPGLEGRQLFDLALALREDALESGGLLLVNDRVDVALSLGLPGVHLGQRSLPPQVVRGLVGGERVLGVSVHDRGEAEEGERGGADYLLVGTLFPTPSHPGVSPGGVGRIQEVARVTSLPLVGIGGITVARVGETLAAGADGVGVRGGVWERSAPGDAVLEYLEEILRGRRDS
jgi:thiamine-phosphate pyrophosphorylase